MPAGGKRRLGIRSGSKPAGAVQHQQQQQQNADEERPCGSEEEAVAPSTVVAPLAQSDNQGAVRRAHHFGSDGTDDIDGDDMPPRSAEVTAAYTGVADDEDAAVADSVAHHQHDRRSRRRDGDDGRRTTRIHRRRDDGSRSPGATFRDRRTPSASSSDTVSSTERLVSRRTRGTPATSSQSGGGRLSRHGHRSSKDDAMQGHVSGGPSFGNEEGAAGLVTDNADALLGDDDEEVADAPDPADETDDPDRVRPLWENTAPILPPPTPLMAGEAASGTHGDGAGLGGGGALGSEAHAMKPPPPAGDEPIKRVVQFLLAIDGARARIASIAEALEWDDVYEPSFGDLREFLELHSSLLVVSPIGGMVTFRDAAKFTGSRRVTKANREAILSYSASIGHVSCTSVAKRIKLNDLRTIYHRRGLEAKIVDDAILHVAYEGAFDLFVFEEGAVVWWGASRSDHWVVEADFVAHNHVTAHALIERHDAADVAALFPIWWTYSVGKRGAATDLSSTAAATMSAASPLPMPSPSIAVPPRMPAAGARHTEDEGDETLLPVRKLGTAAPLASVELAATGGSIATVVSSSYGSSPASYGQPTFPRNPVRRYGMPVTPPSIGQPTMASPPPVISPVGGGGQPPVSVSPPDDNEVAMPQRACADADAAGDAAHGRRVDHHIDHHGRHAAQAAATDSSRATASTTMGASPDVPVAGVHPSSSVTQRPALQLQQAPAPVRPRAGSFAAAGSFGSFAGYTSDQGLLGAPRRRELPPRAARRKADKDASISTTTALASVTRPPPTAVVAGPEALPAADRRNFAEALPHDHFVVPAVDRVNVMMAVSCALAQSVTVDYLEYKISALSRSSMQLPQQLRLHGAAAGADDTNNDGGDPRRGGGGRMERDNQAHPALAIEDAYRAAGNLHVHKSAEFGLTEEPIFIWERPRYLEYYELAFEQLSLRQRADWLHSRINVMSEAVSAMTAHLHLQAMIRADWFLILLLLVDSIVLLTRLIVAIFFSIEDPDDPYFIAEELAMTAAWGSGGHPAHHIFDGHGNSVMPW